MKPNAPRSIDAVYTWVNGQDPVWVGKRAQYAPSAAAAQQAVHPSAVGDNRFADHDELKFSLRSLERHAPWIQQLFLVTDGQQPAWINPTTVTLVDHREIFPDNSALPVFSSTPIEMCLHRIEGLSEHFLSLNDDFFLGRDVQPADFFTSDGRPIIWANRFSRRRIARYFNQPLESFSFHEVRDVRARRLVQQRWGYQADFKVRHHPRSMTRSIMQKVWDEYPEVIEHNLHSPFRSAADTLVVPALFSYHAAATGQARVRIINGPIQLWDVLRGGIHNIGTSMGDHNFQRKMRMIQCLRPKTYCINDGDGRQAGDLALMRSWLSKEFQDNSKYER